MSQPKIIRHAGSFATVFGLWAVAASGTEVQTSKSAQQASAANISQVHYHVVHGWPVLPENTILDEVSAVGVDSQDNVLVLQRKQKKGVASTEAKERGRIYIFDI